MEVLVLTASDRRAWWERARRSLERHLPGASVRPVVADPRPPRRPPAGAVLPHGWRVAGARWADAALGLGPRAAAWAALPSLAAGATGPLLVLADTVELLDGPAALLDGGDGRPALRAARVDAAGWAWGGALPGVVHLPGAAPGFLGWWERRVAAALVDGGPSGGRLPWAEVPADRVRLVTDPALRLAATTLGELAGRLGGPDGGGRPLVDGAPVALADLDGLDPARPWWFAPAGREPDVRVSQVPSLRPLLHRAAAELSDTGGTGGPTPWTEVPGVSVTPALRRWFRGRLADGDPVPNPLVPGEVGAFLDLLAGPGAPAPHGSGVSLHADLVLEHRPDVRAAFANVRWADRDAFLRWMWTHGLDEGETSLALLPDLPSRPPVPPVRVGAEPRREGVNVVGYLTGELGLGVAARRMVRALESAGVPVATVPYDRTSSRRRAGAAGGRDAPYDTNLLLITPDQLPFFVGDVGPGFLEGRRNVGLWYWETDVLTDRQLSSFRWVDEVWGATRYLCDVFAAYGRVPVHHVPVPLVFDDPGTTPADRARLGLDDRFTVLFSFDFLSVAARKNPLGLLGAYRRAFGPDDGARLVLKSINGGEFPEELERLLDAVADRPDVEVWDRYLDAGDRLALVAAADCYASLHRSEGLGLTMAEAMAVGTPVVATAYSGNLDFMDDTSALMVPATEVPIGPGHLYPAEGHWAEPDLDVAAAHLRHLRDDPALRAALGAAGRRALAPFGYEEVGRAAAARLRDGAGRGLGQAS